MAKSGLRPISIDRVQNRLAHDIKHGPTKTFRDLHSEALNKVKALETDLTAVEDAIKELEATYADIDAARRKMRERHVKLHGKASPGLPIFDSNTANQIERRVAAQEIGAGITKQLDIALKNFLDGGVTLTELRAAAELGVGAFAMAAPFTFALEAFKGLDRSIDRLGQLRDAGEQYALKVEIFSLVVAGFSTLLRILQQKIEDELTVLFS